MKPAKQTTLFGHQNKTSNPVKKLWNYAVNKAIAEEQANNLLNQEYKYGIEPSLSENMNSLSQEVIAMNNNFGNQTFISPIAGDLIQQKLGCSSFSHI